MKVRWTADSIRLRITPTELEALRGGNAVAERAAFPCGWTMVLGRAAATDLVSSTPGALHLMLGHDDFAALDQPDSEGVYPVAGGTRCLVEKDFPCVHPRPSAALETSETFPAPPGFADRKA
ncbi:MAG: DUF7009 family protein [Armatimonadota bacterium]